MSKAYAARGAGVSRYLRDIGEYVPRKDGRPVGPRPEGSAGSDETYHDLITSNLAFVVKVASEYRNFGLPFEDLLNEGNLGLIEAARRYDPTRGARFISYASWWIRKSIIKALTQNATIVRVPEYQQKLARNVRDTGRLLARKLGREAARDEISRQLNVPVEQVDKVLLRQMRDLSLDDKVASEGDATVLDRLVDWCAVSPEEGMIRKQDRALLYRALRMLSARQLSVIIDRFGLEGGPRRTLQEIGARLGMSREGVRQIESQATQRLRKAMTRRLRVPHLCAQSGDHARCSPQPAGPSSPPLASPA